LGIKDIFRTVRNFLFSNVNKQFLVFLFFLLLSSIFWLMMTLNETYEKEIRVPVHVATPKNVMLTSNDTDTIRVTVRDKGWVLLRYLYGKKIGVLTINSKSYDRGNGSGAVSSSDLRRFTEQRLELSTKIVSVKPDKLEFFYNNGERKRVPVRWTGRVIPDQLYFIAEVAYSPDSVDVYAAPEKLDSITAVYTEPLNYASFRDTLSVDCRLSHDHNVKVVPERSRVTFCTDVLTEESIDGVPIQCINLPPGKVVRTFPPKIKVHFVAGVSQIRHLRPEDFTVIADYLEIMQRPSEKCNIYLRHVPQGINRATLDAKQVDYLIENEE